MVSQSFSAAGFGLRLLFSLLLVGVSYNPSGWSYVHWFRDALPDLGPWIVLAGLVLVIGWTIFLRATFRSLGGFGLVLMLGLCGTLLWLVIDLGLVPADSAEAVTYSVLIMISLVLAVGMSWSHIRRRLSGQLDVDDVDQD